LCEETPSLGGKIETKRGATGRLMINLSEGCG
jgi:hypothetical protein